MIPPSEIGSTSQAHPGFTPCQESPIRGGPGSGFTDRVSKKVRDELGLAYSCYANITRSADEEPGMFAAHLACAPENETQAVEALTAEVRRFVEEGPTEQELRDAKDYLVASRAFEFETTAEMAAYWKDARHEGIAVANRATNLARGPHHDIRGDPPSQVHEDSTGQIHRAARLRNNEEIHVAVRVGRRFVGEGPTEQELRDAKDYLVASRAFEFETTAEMAGYWLEAEQLGLSADELTTFAGRIEAVTREDVLRVARAHLHPDASAVVRVGPAIHQAAHPRPTNCRRPCAAGCRCSRASF